MTKAFRSYWRWNNGTFCDPDVLHDLSMLRLSRNNLPCPFHYCPAVTDASHVALLNGLASRVHDYDAAHLPTIIHPTGPVASALFSQAEALGGVKGNDFILALAGKLIFFPQGTNPDQISAPHHEHPAVAVGKLMPSGARRCNIYAISIATTEVTGLREMFGTDTKSFHGGRTAQNGLMAAKAGRQTQIDA
ncbi:hypothetical protein B0H14DRAFT_3466099 [Mycena olivaceomarginata]|nr:hypothetical protein B0H14DRAFT_3466099 [Mycena olivaceomarginata]